MDRVTGSVPIFGKLWGPPKPNSDFSNSQNIIGQLLWPVIVMLKFMGFCPISQCENKDRKNGHVQKIKSWPKHNYPSLDGSDSNHLDNQDTDVAIQNDMKYGIVLKSKFFVWSLFVFFSFSYSEISSLLDSNSVHDNDWHIMNQQVFQALAHSSGKNGKGIVQSMINVLTVVEIVQAFSVFAENIFSWTEAKAFANFLNKWKIFQQEFTQTFPATIQPFNTDRLKKRRTLILLVYVGAPSICILIASIMSAKKNDVISFLFSFLGIAPTFFRSISALLLEDIKVFLSYDSVADAFSQIREGIEYQLKWDQLYPKKVKMWRELVQQVRQQVLLTGQLQKNHQLFVIASTIILLTTMAYLLLCWIWLSMHLAGAILGIQGIGMILFVTSRIYLKILAADMISKNESLIVYELQHIDTSKYDLGTQLEIKFIHDMIKQDPSKMSFGGYVILNKRLLLGVFSQVVTYLIVLMQFSQSRAN